MEQGPNDPKLPAPPAKPDASSTATAGSTVAAPGKAEAEAGKVDKGASVRRVTVRYNTDYDPIPEGRRRPVLRRDRSEVAAAAFDVKDAIAAFGLDADIMGVEGRDLAECVTKLRKNTPDLIFNL